MSVSMRSFLLVFVALRKESVDRNYSYFLWRCTKWMVALRKESVDRNATVNTVISCIMGSRSPQGERG